MTAMSLAFLMAPYGLVERVVVLASTGLGIFLAAVIPGLDRQAVRLVGPAVLLIALLPTTMPWAVVDVCCLVIVGFAVVNRAGMSRAVPAMGLPLATLSYDASDELSTGLLLAWVLCVIITLLAAGVSGPSEFGPEVGHLRHVGADVVVP